MQLEDRFYTSTEVAEILGVSLRSVYRYLEDEKLDAEVKTATGRHRFTRQNILDFLYPEGSKNNIFDEGNSEPTKINITTPQINISKTPVVPTQPQVSTQPIEPIASPQPQPVQQEEEEEPVDWLAKFREAASKYKEEAKVEPIAAPAPQPIPQTYRAPTPEPVHVQPAAPTKEPEPGIIYYRSMLGGLKDIAQNLDKSARNSNLDYAFTLNAGASLHKPIKPFATLHAYVRSTDRDFFEKILRLTASNRSSAQLALVISDEASIYNNREEVHGLFVVQKHQLKKDIVTFGDAQLAQEVADIL